VAAVLLEAVLVAAVLEPVGWVPAAVQVEADLAVLRRKLSPREQSKFQSAGSELKCSAHCLHSGTDISNAKIYVHSSFINRRYFWRKHVGPTKEFGFHSVRCPYPAGSG
jgi:hypothetical protein